MLFILAVTLASSALAEDCGGRLTANRGLIQTPGFPQSFATPINCRWVIDSSAHPSPVTTVVYLTQVFVTAGLRFTEYAYYEPDATSFQLEPKVLHVVTEENVVTPAVVATNRSFLVIDFAMDRLEGNHLRASDGLLDVFGFNVTFNVIPGTGKVPVEHSCSAIKCSLLGHCFATHDHSSFWCECFAGFSGPQCSEGPLCRADTNPCQNNATCRHVGANDVSCGCSPGFTGPTCAQPLSTQECDEGANCVKQCRYDETKESICSCDKNGIKAFQDTSHFECTLRLVNTSAITESSRPLEQRLLKQMTKYLRGANLSKYEDAKVMNLKSTGEVKFHFVGSKGDGNRIRDLLLALVAKAKLANFTLNPSHFSFKQQPTLLLQSVTVNRKDGRVGLGDDFRLTCLAQGSTSISFKWLKDGALVNQSLSIRKINASVGLQDSSDKMSSYLTIDRAEALDEGEYTCQVVDWGMQQCKSIRISVIQPLKVTVAPTSSTVQKGSNLTLRCSASNKPGRRKLGYNWTRNKALFPMVPGKEFWEDLYPDGSILKLYNVQKGGVFTCQAVEGVWSGEASGRVDVLDRLLSGSSCPSEGPWPAASPGLQAFTHCPSGYVSTATRLCLLIEPGKGRWQVPDYSKCVSHHTTTITRNFELLTLGYEATTVRETVFELASWHGGRTSVYPGEAEPLVDLLRKVLSYLNATANSGALVLSTPNFFTAVSALLLRNSSIINQQTVLQLERTVREWALIWAHHSGGTFNHIAEGGVVVNTYKINPMQKHVSVSLPRPGFRYPDWLKTRVSAQINNKSRQNDSVIAVIVYRDLGQFFPKHFSQKSPDGRDLEFSVASPVVSIYGSGGLSLAMRLVVPEGSLCGRTVSGQHWDLDHCNLTRGTTRDEATCFCPSLGIYAPLDPHTQPHFKRAELRWRSSFSVMVGCTCCLVQVTLTVCLLALRWWHHSSCILFLKLQCSASIAATMIIFIYTSKERAPQAWYLYLSIALQFFLLIAISTQLAKLVIVYSEVLRIPSVKYLQQTVIFILTGLCGVCGLCCVVVSDYTLDQGWWWLRKGTTMFYITTSYAGALLGLYIFIGSDLAFKLRSLIHKDSKTRRTAAIRRVGLVKRSAVVLSVTLVMAASSVLYANNPSPLNQSIFSVTCGALGFTILICYVVLSENSPKNLKFIKKLHSLGTEEVYSSTSDNSFFTKQEPDAECQAAPPPDVTPRPTEEILLKPALNKTPSTPRKSVSFHSDLVTGCAVIEELSDSPEAKNHIVSASYFQNPPTDPAQGCLQEIVTTRVCLELGLLQDKNHSPPTVMVCNVDIEPSTRLISLPDSSDSMPHLEDNKDVLNRITHDLDYLLNANEIGCDTGETQTTL